jgi:teichoic acid transport system permease protein
MTHDLKFPARTVRRSLTYLSELWRRRDFALYLAVGNLKARHATTAFGLFWWVLNPLLLAAVYYLVFSVIFPGARGDDDYLAYLVSGMFVFHFTSLSMTGGANSIIQNSKLLVNLRFPRLILPVAGLIESGIGFLVSLGVLFLIVGPISGIWPSPQIVILALAIPLQVVLNLGLGSLSARLAIPFRDINNLIPYLNRLWLYTSPIIWPISRLGDLDAPLRTIVNLNPMTSLLDVYRSALIGWTFDPESLAIAALWSLALGVIGVGLFVKYEGHIVRYL